MKYTVVWNPDAEARLAELWNASGDRAAISQAIDELEVILRSRPLFGAQFSRQVGSYTLVRPPLAVAYEVFEADRLVRVWAVWRRG